MFVIHNTKNIARWVNDCGVETPEIQLVDFNGDGLKDFQFTRLKHNGTYNAIQTTIVGIKNHRIDTLSTTEKVIGSYN